MNWHDWMRDVKKIDKNDKETIALIWEVVSLATIDAEEKLTSTNKDLAKSCDGCNHYNGSIDVPPCCNCSRNKVDKYESTDFAKS